MSNEKQETIEDIVAEMRDEASERSADASCAMECAILRHYSDRIEAAAERERTAIEEANDDTPLVMSCLTCAHYSGKRQYCPAQDAAVARVCAHLRPVFADGPCNRWECKYTKRK